MSGPSVRVLEGELSAALLDEVEYDVVDDEGPVDRVGLGVLGLRAGRVESIRGAGGEVEGHPHQAASGVRCRVGVRRVGRAVAGGGDLG